MVDGARFIGREDIPFCPTTAYEIPKRIITYSEARRIYKKKLRGGNRNFKFDAFVGFYEDDQNFDTTGGIWFKWKYALRILQHFAGIITPDFSTNLDFPKPLRSWNTYRMRAFGYWYGKLGYQVINNVRWNDEESFSWCFHGIPKNSMVCIGTVASGLKKKENRPLFVIGIRKMMEALKPKIVLVYGSANYPIFDELRKEGVEIVSFMSQTNQAFKKGGNDHE